MEVKQEPEGLFIEEFNIDIEEHTIQGETITECRNYEKGNIELSRTVKNEFVSIKKETENYLRIDNLQQTCIEEVKNEIEQIIDDTGIKCNSIQLADNKQSKKYSTTMDESMETKRARESGELSVLYNDVHQDGNYENGSNNNTSIHPQDNTIKDISNSTTQTLLGTSPVNTIDTISLEQLEEINLRSLLTEWNLASLTKHLISQNVFVDILKIMRRHHIERLLQNFDLGTQILFEHNLEQWRESIGLALDHYSSRVYSCQNIHNSPSSPPATSSGRHTPDNNTSSNIHLAIILNESSRGILLVEYYNKFLRFQEEQRYSLISLIALYFQEKGVKMTLADSHNIEREILERFPSEKLEYYRTSKRGKIYTKYCNMATSFKAAVSKLSKGKKQEGSNKNKSRYGSDLEPEQDAESCLQALKFDNLTSEQFDATWKACYQFRLEYIKCNDIANIMKEWPFYRTPSGYRLIDMDFKAAFGGKDGLLKEWDQTFEKIISFLLIDSRIKDKNARQLLEKLKDGNTSITENGRNAALFWAVHGYLVPTNKVVKKDLATGKMTTTKFTIKGSQESVLFLGKNQQEIEERINQIKKTNVSIQPSIYCIGKDIFSIEDVCLIFDDIRFKFSDLLRALDICFKIIYLFNLEFPAESLTFYSFIEIYFYKFKPVSNTNSRVHILCEYLSDQSIQ